MSKAMDGSTIEARVLAAALRSPAGRRRSARLDAIRRLTVWFRNERRIRRSIDNDGGPSAGEPLLGTDLLHSPSTGRSATPRGDRERKAGLHRR
jgi:hypothetical protein